MDPHRVSTSESYDSRSTQSPQSDSKDAGVNQSKIKQRTSATARILSSGDRQSDGRKKMLGFQRIAWSHELTEDERRQEEVVFNLFPLKKPPHQSETAHSGKVPRRSEPPRRRELPSLNLLLSQGEMAQNPTKFGTAAQRLPVYAQTGPQYYHQKHRGTDRVHFDPPKRSRPFTRPPGRPANRTSDSTFAGCTFGNFMATSVYEMPPPLPESYNKPYQPGDEVSWIEQATPTRRNHGNGNTGSRGDKNTQGYEREEFTSRFNHHAPAQAQLQNRFQRRLQTPPEIHPGRPVPTVPATIRREQTQDVHFGTALTGSEEYYGDDIYLGREHFSDHVFAHPPRSHFFPGPSPPMVSNSRPTSPSPVSAPTFGGQKRTRNREFVYAGDEEPRRKKICGNYRPPTAERKIDGDDNNGGREGDKKNEGDE